MTVSQPCATFDKLDDKIFEQTCLVHGIRREDRVGVECGGLKDVIVVAVIVVLLVLVLFHRLDVHHAEDPLAAVICWQRKMRENILNHGLKSRIYSDQASKLCTCIGLSIFPVDVPLGQIISVFGLPGRTQHSAVNVIQST